MKTTKTKWNKLFLAAMLTVTLVFGLVLTGCDDGNDPSGGDVIKDFNLKGDLKQLKVSQGVEPKKVVVYDNPKFEGKSLGEGDIGGGGGSLSVLAARSIGGVSRSIGTVNEYTNDTDWEISLTGISQNDSPELYFAVTGVMNDMGTEFPFMYPIDGFELPVSGISDGANFDINTGIPNNNPFNDGIELEFIGFSGAVTITGVNTADIPKFASGQDVWLMVYDANGAEIGGTPFSMAPRSVAETWTQDDIDMKENQGYWTGMEISKPTAGAVHYPINSVDFLLMIPARAGTLTFDLAFGNEDSKTRANVSGIGSYNLTDAKLTFVFSGPSSAAPRIEGVVLETADITGVTIP